MSDSLIIRLDEQMRTVFRRLQGIESDVESLQESSRVCMESRKDAERQMTTQIDKFNDRIDKMEESLQDLHSLPEKVRVVMDGREERRNDKDRNLKLWLGLIALFGTLISSTVAYLIALIGAP